MTNLTARIIVTTDPELDDHRVRPLCVGCRPRGFAAVPHRGVDARERLDGRPDRARVPGVGDGKQMADGFDPEDYFGVPDAAAEGNAPCCSRRSG